MPPTASSAGSGPAAAGSSQGAFESTSHFLWQGCGETGCLLPVQPGGSEVVQGFSSSARRVTSLTESRETCRALGVRDSTLDAFFLAGGRALTLLPVARDPLRWMGEDGGPGERSGLQAFRDLPEISSVILPPLPADRVADVSRHAGERPELFLYMSSLGGALDKTKRGGAIGGQDSSRAASSGAVASRAASSREVPSRVMLEWQSGNFVVLRLPSATQGAPRSGRDIALALSGIVESRDPVLSRRGTSSARRVSAPLREFEDPDLILGFESQLAAGGMGEWRLWWGLERSLDLGSRWVLFEPNHRLIWGRLEREARAFLHDLSFDGILPPWGSAGWEVRCDPVPGEEGRVRFRVVVDTVRSCIRPDSRSNIPVAEEIEPESESARPLETKEEDSRAR